MAIINNITTQPQIKQEQVSVKQEQRGPLPAQHHAMPPNGHQPAPQHLAGSLEPSLDSFEPYNDMERQICDFLFANIIQPDLQSQFNQHTKVEIEAKLGSLQDYSNPAERLRLPIMTDVILAPTASKPRFESSMRTDQHKYLNKYLNDALAQSQRPGRQKIIYKHTRETDYFYEIPTRAYDLIDPAVLHYINATGKKSAPRLRVTRDNATNAITAIIIKTRIADLEMRCPRDEFDVRISISLETNWVHPGWESFSEHLDAGVRTQRGKDRLSYQHQGFLVDLTQVTPFGAAAQKIHELEIEMDVNRLMEEGRKNAAGMENEYEKLVHVFLNNIKVVNRAAKPASLPAQGGQMR
jgi:hypothetical protein